MVAGADGGVDLVLECVNFVGDVGDGVLQLAEPAFAGDEARGPAERTELDEAVARGKLAFERDELIVGAKVGGQGDAPVRWSQR